MGACIVCGKPARRLHWDYFGAALDDVGQWCSFECAARWERNDYPHPAWCQCVTCVKERDDAKKR